MTPHYCRRPARRQRPAPPMDSGGAVRGVMYGLAIELVAGGLLAMWWIR